MGNIYTNPPQSRNEEIIRATIDGTEYTDPPQSRIEDLLLELKEAIVPGESVIIDNALSNESEHPVQNKVISAALNSKAEIDDTTPASNKVYSSEKVEAVALTKLDASYAQIVAGGNNLVDFANSKYNFRPSSSYTDGKQEAGAFTTNLIPCERNEKIKFYVETIPSSLYVYAFRSDETIRNTTNAFVLDDDGYYYVQPNFSDMVSIAFVLRDTTRANFETLVVGRYDTFSMSDITFPDLYFTDKNISMAKGRLKYANDVLYGKKWVVAGDSFSAGTAISDTIPSGKYEGQPAVYPYIIGNRTEMEVVRFFEGGRSLAYPADETSTNSFAYIYQTIPADADYLTIYLGINDSHKASAEEGQIPLGTITDDTTATFYGAWNVILTWLIANRPNLHIGIIVSNGCDSDDYRTATIAIAQKYGIPYIDMNGDKQTPCMMRSTNASIDAAVREQRTNNWKLSNDNTHPNAACHAFKATFIEDFLRTL